MIKSNGEYLVPNGATEIKSNYTLIVLSDTKEGLEKVDECLLNKVTPLDF